MGRRFLAGFAILMGCTVACSGRSEKRGVAATGGSAGSGGARGGMGGSAGKVINGGGCERGFEPLDEEDPRCGDELCAPLPRTDVRLGYAHCCTPSGRCGSGWESIFGGACFPRDNPGTTSDECPTEIVFVYYDFVSGASIVDEFPGCCLPDGRCGLDTSASLGAGCVERSELSSAVQSGCEPENADVRFEPMVCTP